MVKLWEVRFRHALRFCEVAELMEQTYRERGTAAGVSISEHRASAPQIRGAIDWLESVAQEDEAASELLWRFITRGGFSIEGDSLEELHFSGRERETHLERSLELFRQRGNTSRVALVAYGLGRVLSQKQQYHASKKHFRHAFDLFEYACDDFHCGIALFGLAGAYIGDEEHCLAIDCSNRAIALFEKLRSPWQATALLQLGHSLESTGQSPEARSAYERAVEVFNTFGDRVRVVAALVALGGNCVHSGDLDQGRVHLTEAVRLLDLNGDIRGGLYTTNLADIGLRLVAAGDRDGIAYIERDLKYFRRIGNRTGVGFTLVALGSARMAFADRVEADQALVEALDVFDEVKNRMGKALAHHQLARNELAKKCWKASIEHANQAVEGFRSLSRSNEAFALATRAKAQAGVGAASDAIAGVEQALTMLESIGHKDAIKVRVLLEDLKRSAKA